MSDSSRDSQAKTGAKTVSMILKEKYGGLGSLEKWLSTVTDARYETTIPWNKMTKQQAVHHLTNTFDDALCYPKCPTCKATYKKRWDEDMGWSAHRIDRLSWRPLPDEKQTMEHILDEYSRRCKGGPSQLTERRNEFYVSLAKLAYEMHELTSAVCPTEAKTAAKTAEGQSGLAQSSNTSQSQPYTSGCRTGRMPEDFRDKIKTAARMVSEGLSEHHLRYNPGDWKDAEAGQTEVPGGHKQEVDATNRKTDLPIRTLGQEELPYNPDTDLSIKDFWESAEKHNTSATKLALDLLKKPSIFTKSARCCQSDVYHNLNTIINDTRYQKRSYDTREQILDGIKEVLETVDSVSSLAKNNVKHVPMSQETESKMTCKQALKICLSSCFDRRGSLMSTGWCDKCMIPFEPSTVKKKTQYQGRQMMERVLNVYDRALSSEDEDSLKEVLSQMGCSTSKSRPSDFDRVMSSSDALETLGNLMRIVGAKTQNCPTFDAISEPKLADQIADATTNYGARHVMKLNHKRMHNLSKSQSCCTKNMNRTEEEIKTRKAAFDIISKQLHSL